MASEHFLLQMLRHMHSSVCWPAPKLQPSARPHRRLKAREASAIKVVPVFSISSSIAAFAITRRSYVPFFSFPACGQQLLLLHHRPDTLVRASQARIQEGQESVAVLYRRDSGDGVLGGETSAGIISEPK